MKFIGRTTVGFLASLMAIIMLSASSRSAAAQLDATADPAATARQAFVATLDQQKPVTTETNEVINAATGTTSAMSYPHPVLYGGGNSSGWPFVGTVDDTTPPDNAPLNWAVLDAYARFPMVILPPTPMSDARLDIIPALRSRNPNLKIFAYVTGHLTWCPGFPGNINYPVGYYYRDYFLAVTGGDQNCSSTSNGFLWNQDGTRSGYNVNLAYRELQPDNSYRYTVAENIAAAMYEHAKTSRGFDGIFIDVFCPNFMWAENPANPWDYARAGYGSDNSDPANQTAFMAGWTAGHFRLAEHLRELAVADGQPDYPISGNCGQAPSTLHPVMNGWMRENYPYQNGGTFYDNMLAWPWGYLHQDQNFRSPQYDFIFTAAQLNGYDSNGLPTFDPSDAWNQRKMRFGLGSASLGTGLAAFHDSSGDPSHGLWFNWWYDEYGVDTAVPQADSDFGHAHTGSQYIGWLGSAVTPAQALLATNYATTTDLLTSNQGFETAASGGFSDWTTFINAGLGNTVDQDTTTAAVGTASVKVTIVTPNMVAQNVSLVTGDFPVTANSEYAVTFWAKGSVNLPLLASLGGGTTNASQTIRIDAQWRQYQVVIASTTSTASTRVVLGFGLGTGTYWVDDVHVQRGATAVWRRDFTHGIVLVNPTAGALTVNLEKPFKKITGIVNPGLNDGSIVSQVTIAGTGSGSGTGDAVFLLNRDIIPPSTVTDLRTD